MRWDIIVIGAGPSGSCAAYHLARTGYQVLLVDKNAFPRPKACGDGLTPRALAALDRMGLRALWSRCLRIDGLRIVDDRSGVETIRGFHDDNGVHFGGVLPRSDLDNELLKCAVKAGVHVLTETTAVKLLNTTGGIIAHLSGLHGPLKYDSRFVVVADGASRLSYGLVQRPARTALKLFAMRQYFNSTIDVGPYFEVHVPLMDDGSCIAGYTWIFPVSKGILNVGSGFARTANSSGNLRHMYDGSVRSLIERGRLDGRPCSPIMGAPLAVDLEPAKSVGEGWIVVGDAAGVVNPFTGEGIAQALESGELAYQAIDRALRMGTTMASDYPRLLEDRFGRRLRLGPVIPDLLGSVRTSYRRESLKDDLRPRNQSAARAVRNIVLDHKTSHRSALWVQLTKDISDPRLRAAFDEVGSRIMEELSLASPLFAEIASEMRTDENPCAYSTMLVLAVAASCGGIDEQAIQLAELIELVTLQDRLHGDVPVRFESSNRSTSFDVLAGDAIIARLFAVLNGFERTKAAEISARLQAHADYAATFCIKGGASHSSHIPVALVAYAVRLITEDRMASGYAFVEDWSRNLLSALQALLDIDEAAPAKDWQPIHRKILSAAKALHTSGIVRPNEMLRLLTANLAGLIRTEDNSARMAATDSVNDQEAVPDQLRYQ